MFLSWIRNAAGAEVGYTAVGKFNPWKWGRVCANGFAALVLVVLSHSSLLVLCEADWTSRYDMIKTFIDASQRFTFLLGSAKRLSLPHASRAEIHQYVFFFLRAAIVMIGIKPHMQRRLCSDGTAVNRLTSVCYVSRRICCHTSYFWFTCIDERAPSFSFMCPLHCVQWRVRC